MTFYYVLVPEIVKLTTTCFGMSAIVLLSTCM